MSERTLETVELETGARPTASIVWLHGVGADGHQFEPLAGQLTRPSGPALRLVLPHAPWRRITLCNGERMRGWYDLRNVDRQLQQDEEAIRASCAAVGALIRRECARGIPSERIVLGGFSQGAAMSLFIGPRFPSKLAGVIALSGYRLIASTLGAERQACNADTPIFLAHGTADPVIAARDGELARDMLRAQGYAVEWHTYPIGHEMSAEEIAAVAEFLAGIL
ncbi:MAG TPA: dienelactone hydrolase family protein [Steroidobacteraceae bacterium]|nr:dienelactone hydrolase family protein [Steroidobacteraceae bacterium]